MAYLLALLPGQLAAQVNAPTAEEQEVVSTKPLLALDTGGHTNGIYKLLATKYADELISVGLDKTIRFWDLNTGEPLRVLRPPIGPGAHGYLFSAAISPDGKLLAVGGYRAQTPLYDHRIHLIAVPEDRIVRSLKGHAYAVYDLAFSPDGRQLASASHDGTVRIWNVDSGEPTQVLKGHTTIVHSVAWNSDSTRVVSGSYDKTARIWTVATGKSDSILRESQGQINTVAWSPDGRTIATGSTDKSVRLYEPSGKLRYSWPKLPNEITSVEFSPDSKRVLYTFGSNLDPPVGAAVLDMVDGHQHSRFTGHTDGVLCGTFLRDGKQVATGDSISSIRIWDPKTGTQVARLEGQGRRMVSAGWSPDGQAIAWGNATREATIDFGGLLERTFCLRQLDFGPPPDKKFARARPKLGNKQIGVVTVVGQPPTREQMHRVTILRGGAVLAKFELPQPYDQVRCYTLLGETQAAVGSNDGAYLIDSNTGLVQRELMDRGELVWGMAPSPDSRYLLTAGNDQMLKVWHVDSGQLLLSLFVAGSEWIAWTPQGYYAASLAGESLMGWQINNGPEQLAAYYPAARFHKSLYRPDVIRRVLATGNIKQSVELADKEREVESRQIVIADVLPPKVTIRQPSEPKIEQREAGLTVHATAEPVDNDPLTALRLIVDGRPFGPAKPAPATGKAEPVDAEWQVELPPGKHELVVKAETAESFGLSAPLEVSRTVEGDGAIPGGNLYVLAIGAGQGPAPSADAKSAQAIAAAVKARGGAPFGDVVVRELTDAQATTEGVAFQLDRLHSEMTPADTAIIYYAGAATAGPQRAGHAGDLRLSTAPPAPGGQAGALSGQTLAEKLSAISGRVALVLDTHQLEKSQAQRNATVGYCGSSDDASSDGVEQATSELLRELLSEEYGIVVMSSLRPAAASGASAAAPSAFGGALGEAMGGKADADQDGVVYLHELAPYVNRRVRELSGDKQSSTIQRPRGVRSYPIGPAAK